tara:strand:- start:4774 stop:5118 length:345 start_codon:yes stop_codon:yes gene_type:complete
MSKIPGTFDPLKVLEPPELMQCMGCNSAYATELYTFKIQSYKDAVVIQDLKSDVIRLEQKITDIIGNSLIRKAIILFLLIGTSVFTFADILPDLPRRTKRRDDCIDIELEMNHT